MAINRSVRWGVAVLAAIGAAAAAGSPAGADVGTGPGTGGAPTIVSVTATPPGPEPGEVYLPIDAGTVRFSAQVTGADRVVFMLDKPGKGLVTIGDDRTAADGFSTDYTVKAYFSGSLWVCSKLIVKAVSSSGGEVQQFAMNVFNDRLNN